MAGMIRAAALKDDSLEFDLMLQPQHSTADEQRLRTTLTEQIKKMGFDGRIICNPKRLSPASPPPPPTKPKDPVPGERPGPQPHGGPFVKKPIDGVKHVIAVASGKGGVGKSTVSTNLAIALSRNGLNVGLADADIYGPSLPTMMNIQGQPIANEDKKIVPLEAYGIQCISMGFLSQRRRPSFGGVPWSWEPSSVCMKWPTDLMYLDDLPPGTGDAQLTGPNRTFVGALVVTTPQRSPL